MKDTLTLKGFCVPKEGKWKTRRFHGRRSITPMRHKGRKPVKTRCHSRNAFQLPKHTDTLHDGGREGEDKDQHSHDQERKGDQESDPEGKREDTEVHEEAVTLGNSEHSEEPVHPGSIQELRELPASVQVTDETGHEEEEPPF